MSPKEEIGKIRQEIDNFQDAIRNRWKLIKEIESSCQHNWSEPCFVPQKIEYDVGSYGGSYTLRTWERECSFCGKKESTQKEKFFSIPDFGG
jgi:hypothetical protein